MCCDERRRARRASPAPRFRPDSVSAPAEPHDPCVAKGPRDIDGAVIRKMT